MALRTFRDSAGSLWTVWDTVRSSGVPVNAALEEGWLTFESAAGKRRLAPVPRDWAAGSESELQGLLARAGPVPSGSAAVDSSPEQPSAVAPQPSVPPPGEASLRTFTDSSGLVWSVWAVRPGASLRGFDRRQPRDELPAAGGRVQVERRLQVRSEFAGGWLAFHAANGWRRRLMRIPDGWETLPDAQLERCCREARVMPDAER